MDAAPESDEKTIRILLIGGSLREGSVNAAVLKTARADAPANVEAILYERLGDLPLFNPDLDRDPLPEPVAHLRANLGAAGAVLFSTPEYAGSLPEPSRTCSIGPLAAVFMASPWVGSIHRPTVVRMAPTRRCASCWASPAPRSSRPLA